MVLHTISRMKWIFILACFPLMAWPQTEVGKKSSSFQVNGYISDMQSVIASENLQEEIANRLFPSFPDSLIFPGSEIVGNDIQNLNAIEKVPWIMDNQLHNRINAFWYGNNMRATVQLRTRFHWGDQVSYGLLGAPGELEGFTTDGRALSLRYSDGSNFILQSEIDRLWYQFTRNNLEMRVGRQRITWAQTFAFNPNDIFNTYSYFEVDYPEKPGSDALRATYYTGMVSMAEAAVKVDTANRITAGIMYKFNTQGYDIQLLGGYYNETDYVLGTGFAGFVMDAGIRGELSFFMPTENETDNTLVTSVGLDYAFSNSLFLQTEYLYNQIPDKKDGVGIMSLMQEELSAKRLSFTEHSVLLQASYPVTPILNTSLATMLYPNVNGFYVGPTIDYSLTDNLQASFMLQAFSMKGEAERVNTYFGFLRIKGNF